MLKWASRAAMVANVALAVWFAIDGVYNKALWHMALAIFLVVTERRE